MKTLVIDGNNTAFQALGKAPLFYQGKRTEVIKIVLSMLRGYLERFDPDLVIMAWDGGRDERRTSVYPEYKRHKKPPTDAEKKERRAVFEQMDELRPIISGLGIEQCKAAGREGDDTIFTILSHFATEGERIVISTDQDMFQLFYHFHGVQVFNPIKKQMIDADWVEQLLDIPITQFVMYKALVGDGGDNIPGIHGVGPKKANLLIKFLCSAATEEQKRRKLLDVVHSEAELAKQIHLVTLLQVPEEDIAEGWIDADLTCDIDEHMLGVIERYGFNSLVERNRYPVWMEPFLRYNRKRKAQ